MNGFARHCWTTALGSTLGLYLLAGCAVAPVLKPIPNGTPVDIVVSRAPTAGEPVPISNRAIGEGVSAGAGSGVVVGGLWGLACGPLAPLCVPLGAAAGAITGTAAGAVVGLGGALSDSQSAQLRDRLIRARQSHDIVEDLRDHVTDRARKHWPGNAQPSDTELMLELQEVQLASTRDERVSLSLQVVVTVRRIGPGQSPPPDRKVFAYTGPFTALAVWLDERSDFIDTSLSTASQQLAAEIVSELALK
jgi:hypothetical protein